MTTNRTKIAGKYTLWGVVPNCSYTFTGNDRQATFGISGVRTPVNMKALNSLTLDSNVLADPQNIVKIVRAKIVPSGAYGLKAPEGKKAAAFWLDLVNQDGGDYKPLDEIAINFKEWGEWEYINKELKAFNNQSSLSTIGPANFCVYPDYAVFNCDDFNLQADFVGQTVTPVIMLEVETAGFWDSVSQTLF